MIEDAELLRRYVAEKSGGAFAEFVARHIDFVYAAALRQSRGNVALAQDVTQIVFTDAAQKAALLARHEVVVGWLHTATRFATAKAIRSEMRRHSREQIACAMNEIHPAPSAAIEWDQLKPVLDDVLGELKESDRAAILLRFFEQKPLAVVGARLALSETAARSRVDRALERMRDLLARRGITSTAGALAAMLASQPAMAAPAGFAGIVTGAAIAGSAATIGAMTTATFMSMTKLSFAIAGVVALGTTAGLIMQANGIDALRSDLGVAKVQGASLGRWQAENVKLASAARNAAALRDQSQELERVQVEAATAVAQLTTLVIPPPVKKEPAPKVEVPFTGQFFEAREVDAKPTPTFQARPAYPAELRKAEIGGRATLDLVVDAQGHVRNVTVLNTTHPAFAAASLEAVRQWEYTPAQKNGQPVAMHVQLPMIFTLGSSNPPATGGAVKKPAASTFVPWF